jgi:hypothetical protein
MKKQLGRLEQQLFAYVQLRKIRVLRKGDLSGPLQISTNSPPRHGVRRGFLLGSPSLRSRRLSGSVPIEAARSFRKTD